MRDVWGRSPLTMARAALLSEGAAASQDTKDILALLQAADTAAAHSWQHTDRDTEDAAEDPDYVFQSDSDRDDDE